MTENEKMVWAAVYAAGWSAALDKKERYGQMSVPTCIENAWAAVCDMREARAAVVEGWGENHEVLVFLDEMLGDNCK